MAVATEFMTITEEKVSLKLETRGIDSKSLLIAKKNFKQKIRKWQNMFWTLGFPIMMLFVYNLVMQDGEELGDYSAYDISFPGIVVYAVGCATISSAVMFSQAKQDKTLEYMDSMPIGRGNIFVGALLSESLFMVFQVSVVFIVGIGVLGAQYHSVGTLILGYGIAVLYGIGAVGLGIIISSFTDSAESANGIAMMVHWPLMFVSGSFFPFESDMVYFTPHYWAKQVFLQLTVMGDGLDEKLLSSSLIGYTAEPISIPIWGGLLIILAMTSLFICIGLLIFQKKTDL